MELDVGSFDKIRSFVSKFKAKNLPIHILVNNAGADSLLACHITYSLRHNAHDGVGKQPSTLACIPAGIHVPGGDAPEKSGQRTPEGFEVIWYFFVHPSCCIGVRGSVSNVQDAGCHAKLSYNKRRARCILMRLAVCTNLRQLIACEAAREKLRVGNKVTTLSTAYKPTSLSGHLGVCVLQPFHTM